METLHARLVDGAVAELAVWGEILLNCSSVPTRSHKFDFQLFNTGSLSKLAPNSAMLSGGSNDVWSATIPAGSDQPLCVLKYKVDTSLAAASSTVPLDLAVKWECTAQRTRVDVDYAMRQGAINKLLDLKFLIGRSTTHTCMHSTLSYR